jgi:D-glycero-D-manno-heptose 1,7-bisphosphate phosphatase
MKQKALFLDRDGVINIEKDYLYKIEDFEFIDGVFDTCKYFQDQGYLIIIVTNQSGICRDKYTEEDFEVLTSWMIEQFKHQGILISKVLHCPHHPKISGECECRKPNPGMLLESQKLFDIDMSNSIFVGDKNSDIEAGINAGIKNNYLISTGHKIEENKFGVKIIDNLRELIS